MLFHLVSATLTSCSSSVDFLQQVLGPVLQKLSPSSWEVLDKNLIWVSKRPVWFQVKAFVIADSFLFMASP